MQVALYARVSTPNQQQEGTITSQVQSLHLYVRQQGWSLLPTHEYIDEGISGARLDRPALDRLRDCAQRGEFDAVVVLSPDRLARNYAHQWLLIKEFEKPHVQWIFLQNPFGGFCQLSCQLAKLAGGDRIRFRRGGGRWIALPASRLRLLSDQNVQSWATNAFAVGPVRVDLMNGRALCLIACSTPQMWSA